MSKLQYKDILIPAFMFIKYINVLDEFLVEN